MKKIIISILGIIVLINVSLVPVKNLASVDNNTLGIRYTIWDDDYYKNSLAIRIVYVGISILIIGIPSYLIMSFLEKKIGETKPKKNNINYLSGIEDVAIDKVYMFLYNENVGALKEKLFLKFVEYKTAVMQNDFNKLQLILYKNYYDIITKQLGEYNKLGYKCVSHTFVTKGTKIGDIHEEGNLVVITAYLQVNYYDYIENNEGVVISGRQLENVDEFFKIEYIISKKKDDIACLNCGKKVYLENTGKCPYCGTEVLIEAKDYLIRNIEKLGE